MSVCQAAQERRADPVGITTQTLTGGPLLGQQDACFRQSARRPASLGCLSGSAFPSGFRASAALALWQVWLACAGEPVHRPSAHSPVQTEEEPITHGLASALVVVLLAATPVLAAAPASAAVTKGVTAVALTLTPHGAPLRRTVDVYRLATPVVALVQRPASDPEVEPDIRGNALKGAVAGCLLGLVLSSVIHSTEPEAHPARQHAVRCAFAGAVGAGIGAVMAAVP